MNKQKLIPSVNFHLWSACNMRCKFCFANFQDVKTSILPKGHLPEEDAVQIVKAIAKYGFQKITFVGGEPLLCPWLPLLIKTAKEQGLTTMIVTNGSDLTDRFMSINADYLDWITISIDSLDLGINKKIGRGLQGEDPISEEEYLDIVNQINSYGYGLKINTVVNKYNQMEDINTFIKRAKPRRWKIFQALPVVGQNDKYIDEVSVSSLSFQNYVNRHVKANEFIDVVPETNFEMQGSYVMIDPAGRFFDNVSGSHRYSSPILEIGIEKAIEEVEMNYKKFIDRGGLYEESNNE